MTTEKQTPGVDSARRVLQILLQFSESRPEISVEEVARQHAISVPSAYRYIALLRELYLVEERVRGVYVLSPQILRLASAAEASLDLARVAQPFVDRLTERSGETALVLRRVRDSAVCVATAQPHQVLSISFRPGSIMPLTSGAGPKVLFANVPPGKRDIYLDRLEPALSTAERAALVRELDDIGRDGAAESRSEAAEGVWGVASPIMVADRTVASLSIAAAAFRTDEDRRRELRVLVADAAAELSAALAS